MNKRSGELITAGCAKGRGGTWNCATKLSGLNTEHLLELSGLYQVPMHSREAAMKDWPLRQAPCLPQHFFAIRDPPRPAKSAGRAEPPAVTAARGFIPDDRRPSANVNDTPLRYLLGWRFWLCRKLKHRCLLTLEHVRQENRGAVRKFEGVMMHPRLVLVDLPKDCRPVVYRFRPPRGEAKGGGVAFHLLGKSKLCSRKNADRRCGILRRSKPSGTRVEVDCPQCVTDLGRPRFDVVETEVTHGRGSSMFLFTDELTLAATHPLDIEWVSGKGELVRLTD